MRKLFYAVCFCNFVTGSWSGNPAILFCGGSEGTTMTDSRITCFFSLRRVGFVAIFFLAVTAFAQSSPPNQFEGLRWRLVGPFRGGRSEASAGVPRAPMG